MCDSVVQIIFHSYNMHVMSALSTVPKLLILCLLCLITDLTLSESTLVMSVKERFSEQRKLYLTPLNEECIYSPQRLAQTLDGC
jgi:hypothetical protein